MPKHIQKTKGTLPSTQQQKISNLPPLSFINHGHAAPVLEGVNTDIDHYAVTEAGTEAGSLWTLNLSPQPADHKRGMSLTAASYVLLNYGSDNFPSALFLFCN